MSTGQYGTVLLSELDPSKKRVRICARVSRMWEYIKDGKLAHLDLIFIDEKGTKMYAEIASVLADNFKRVLLEGNVYFVRDFLVQSAKNMFRPVEAKFMIKFTSWTKIEQKTNVLVDFPRYAYSLTSFDQLPHLIGRKDSFIDVIGIVTAISDLLHVRLPGQSTDSLKRNLELIDIDERTMPVALWGPHASNFNAEEVYKAAQSKLIIVLLVGTLMKNYRARATIACGDAAKIYINPEIPEKTMYFERLGQQIPAVQWMAAEDDQYHRTFQQSKPEIVKINYLLGTDPNEYLEKNMVCTITIMRLHSNSWWFLACSGCHKTAYPTGTAFVCSDPNCSSVAAGPRYKLRMIGADSTGEVEFVFFAGVAEQIIGKKIDALIRAATRRPDTVPAEITALVTQKYTLNFSLNERGLEYGNLSFQVNSIDAIHQKSKLFEFNALAAAPQQETGASKSLTSDKPSSLKYQKELQVNESADSVTEDSSTLTEQGSMAEGSQVPTQISQTPPSSARQITGFAVDAHSGSKKHTGKRQADDSEKLLTARKLLKED